MRRRALRMVVGLAVLAAGAVVLFVLLRPASPITRENAARIRAGMTRSEVVAILGPPTTDRPLLEPDVIPGPIDPAEFFDGYTVWGDGRHFIGVRFDGAGRVTGTGWLVRSSRDNVLDRLRRWLRL